MGGTKIRIQNDSHSVISFVKIAPNDVLRIQISMNDMIS